MKKAALLVTIVVLVWACAEEQCTPPDKTASSVSTGTVERSELALTMRFMYDKMKLASDSIKAGHRVRTNFLEEFKSIHTDRATEPEKIDEAYHAMASVFLDNYAHFEANTEDQAAAFNNMVESCLACHQYKCPGPVKIINRLRVQ